VTSAFPWIVTEAISSMAPMKSPRPDGLLVAFYIDNWPEVGKEVCNVVFHFFLEWVSR
jgi:hypothetical protein